MAGPSSYMFVAAILFLIGAVGVVVRRDLIVILMAVEIMLNAVNLQILAFARQLGQSEGQVFVFMVMVVAAAEAAIGLAFVLLLYRTRKTINVDNINLMQG
jgi:NADH-quinone oxidoreductase subunit K